MKLKVGRKNLLFGLQPFTFPASALKKILLISSLVACVAIAVTVAIRLWQREESRTAKLPDGSVVTLVATSIGMQPCRYSSDSVLQRWARKVLPPQLQKYLPPSTSGSLSLGPSGSTNHLVIVFLRKVSTGAGGKTFWDRMDALDDDGFIYSNESGSTSSGDAVGCFLRAFPRRQKTFELRMFKQDRLVATFRVDNPIQGPFPKWEPEPVPNTKTNGPLTARLSGVKVETNWQHRPYWKPNVTVNALDETWRGHLDESTWITDPTGNTCSFLSPREAVWKVNVLCSRSPDAPFHSNEIWIVPNIVLPAPAALTELHLTHQIDGIPFEVPVICGAGTLLVTNGYHFGVAPELRNYAGGWSQGGEGTNRFEQWSSDCPMILIRCRDMANVPIVIRFRDERGQLIQAEDTPYGDLTTASGRDYIKRLKKTDAKKIQLEIAVNRPRQFEFLVDSKAINTTGTVKTTQ